MRLLFLNHNPAEVGTYWRALQFGRALQSAGYEVTLVTTRRSGWVSWRDREIDGVRVLESPDLMVGPARTGWDPYDAARRIMRLIGQPFDVVHAWDSRPTVIVPALAVCARAKVPLVMDWCDWWGRGGRIEERSGWPVRTFFGPIETFFEEAFRRRAAASTVISTALGDRLAGLGYPRDQITLLPNGFTPPAANPMSRSEARLHLSRGGYPVREGRPLVVHMGAILDPDVRMLMDAMELIRNDYPDVQLAFVGTTGTRIPVKAGDDAVIVTGFVTPEVRDPWLAAANVCVLPMEDTIGHRARMPTKAGDYMSAGRGIVMTAVGDVARLVETRRLGWTTVPSAEGLADGLRAALRDQAQADAAGARGRDVAGEMTWAAFSKRLDRVYRSLGRK